MATTDLRELCQLAFWSSTADHIISSTTLAPIERLMLMRLLFSAAHRKEWRSDGIEKFQDHETVTGTKAGDIELIKEMGARGLIHIKDHFKLDNWGTLHFTITYRDKVKAAK